MDSRNGSAIATPEALNVLRREIGLCIGDVSSGLEVPEIYNLAEVVNGFSFRLIVRCIRTAVMFF